MPRSLREAICRAGAAAIVVVPVWAAMQPERLTLADAQRLFYNAHYEEAAALAQSLRAAGGQDLANDEVRTTALLFVLRGLLNVQGAHNGDQEESLEKCVRGPR